MKYKFHVDVVNTATTEHRFNAEGLTIEQTMKSITDLIPEWSSVVVIITRENEHD